QTLSLGDVDLLLRNTLHQHELRIDATPPADWGERFVLMGRFQRGLLSTHPGQLADWNGQAFAWFPQVDVSQLRHHVRLGADLLTGQGRLRLWSDIVAGEWAGGSADVDLRGVRLRLAPELAPLGFEKISGRVSGRQGLHDWSVATEQLAFVSDQGLTWPGGNLAVQYNEAQGKTPARGRLQGDRLDLQALREVALRLPLPAAWHGALADHEASGQVRALRLQWEGEARQAITHYEGQIEVDGLHLQTRPGPAPGGRGIAGAQVNAQFSQQGGQLQWKMPQGGWLRWPGLTEEDTLPLQQLQGELRWDLRGDALASAQWKAQLANEDLQGQVQGQWQAASRGPGLLDLQAQVVRAEAARIHRYLPLSLPADVRQYVRESVRKGRLNNLQVRIKGDLAKIPMAQPRDGEFRFAGRLEGVELAAVPPALLPAGSPPWPALQDLQGELVFERQAMRLSGASARLGEGKQALQVGRLRADIPNLVRDAKLDVQAELRGPAQQLLRTLQQSPLDSMLAGVLSQASATGNLQGRLQLAIPLLRTQDTRVQGSVLLAGNDVQINPQVPLLARAQGTLQFTESGFSLQGVQTRLLGGTTRLEGGLRSGPVPAGEPRLLIRAQGQVSAEGLRGAKDLPPLDVLARQMQGQTSYSATLGWQGQLPELTVRSSLEGLELNLPAPLAKRAAQAMPLSISNRVQLGAPRAQDLLQIELGQAVWAQYVRDLSGTSPRVLRGHLQVGARAGPNRSLPEQGVSAAVRLEQLPVDAWAAALASGAATGADEGEAWRSYLPNRLNLQAGTLLAEGRTLHDVVASISREGSTWRAQVDARELNGSAQYLPPDRQQSGRLFARLTRLNLPPAAVSEVESMMEAPPSSMPALDIHIDELVLRGRSLGRVEIEASNPEVRAPRSGSREWQLQKFNVGVPEATLRASGRWTVAAENRPRRTELQFRLDVQDAGALLTRLGTPGALRAGAGHLEGQIGWNGSPMALHYPTLQGQFQVKMGRGQFLKADPGVAKLLGVLSLQGLPRRLLLDFRDVFYEGFAFDSVQGDVQIQQGIASTHNLQIEGVNAVVKMDGSADIARESQQLRVLILPQLNAGGASVVAGLAINPMVGLTAYLAQWLLSRPLSKASIQEFMVDGSWSEPRVTRIESPGGGKPP
ncbi:MAG: YhdP family protein, partial [Limnohabitans sp.]